MSPRKTILQQLSQARESGDPSESYTRPSAIPGFSDEPQKYQRAVNELLKARLLEGQKDDEGHMTIALNGRRLDDVRRELRPIWSRPAVWAMVAVLIAVGTTLAVVGPTAWSPVACSGLM